MTLQPVCRFCGKPVSAFGRVHKRCRFLNELNEGIDDGAKSYEDTLGPEDTGHGDSDLP